MSTDELRKIAIKAISHKIYRALEMPNSSKSIMIAKRMQQKTGISHLELHRFNNAIINRNLERSFSNRRAGEIAWCLLKALLKDTELNAGLRKNIKTFAQDCKVNFNDALETIRAAYYEIYQEKVFEILPPENEY